MGRPKGSKNKQPTKRTPVIDRILARFPDRNPDECWTWTSSLSGAGYGTIRDEGDVRRSTHRLTYQALVGPIPAGLELDHLCRNRACCNPSHLEPVTRIENARRGLRGPGYADDRTHCRNGHLWADNTFIRPDDGRRRCYGCAQAAMRRTSARRSELRRQRRLAA